MPYCPKCGEEVSEDENFCSNCGTDLRDLNLENLAVERDKIEEKQDFRIETQEKKKEFGNMENQLLESSLKQTESALREQISTLRRKKYVGFALFIIFFLVAVVGPVYTVSAGLGGFSTVSIVVSFILAIATLSFGIYYNKKKNKAIDKLEEMKEHRMDEK